MRIARWSARLMVFTYDIQYKPVHENVTADCLSRLPLLSTEPSLEHDLEVVALNSTLTAITSSEFKAACDSCTTCRQKAHTAPDCLIRERETEKKVNSTVTENAAQSMFHFSVDRMSV